MQFLKKAFKQYLQRRGKHIVYRPITEPTGFDLDHDLTLVIAKSDAVIFDVGANVGQSIDQFKSLFANSKIYSFEPAKDCFARLEREKASSDVRIFNVAMGAEAGEVIFHNYENSLLNSVLDLEPNELNRFSNTPLKSSYTVNVQTVDHKLAELGLPFLDLLKIDTQGFDLEVLKGAKNAFESGKIHSVLVELNFVKLYSEQSDPYKIIAFLREHGLQLVGYYDVYRERQCIAWVSALFTKIAK